MNLNGLRTTLAAMAIYSLALGAVHAESGPNEGAQAKRSGDVTNARLADSVTVANNWMVQGGNFGGTHFSPLDQINAANVSRLKPAWVANIDSALGLVAEPLVVDGVAYITAPFSVVYAIDATTGEQLWHFDPEVNPLLIGASVSARFNRGVAVWDGAVYVGTGDCRLVAVDAAKGTKLWDSKACVSFDGTGFAGITASPRAGNGMIFMGYLGSDSAARGSVAAFDAKTGKELWRFWTVPGDPAKGFESEALERAAKTWPDGWAPLGGGAAWDSMNYDPETNLLIVGTASTLPLSVAHRGEGDALYTNSVIAIDASTGEYRWHYQTVPEDGWDLDATMPKIITNIEIDGKKRRVVFEAGKSGFFYVLDLYTGEMLSGDAITKVNWASHIDQKTGRPVLLPGARWWSEEIGGKPTEVFPNVMGARNWEPISYNPDTGLVYMPVVELSTFYCESEHPLPSCPGLTSIGLQVGEAVPPDRGTLLAWDPIERKPRWSVKHQLPFNGGVTSTAGGLVFQGLATGDLKAYSAQDGRELWSSSTGSTISAAPVSYAIGDSQYVLVSMGTGGGTRLIHSQVASSDDGRGPARLVAYKLDGKAKIPEVIKTNVSIPKPPPRVATTPEQLQKADEAWRVGDCSTCHGNDAAALSIYRNGKGGIPDLRYSATLHGGWDEVLMKGALEKQGMANFSQLGMTQESSDLIRAYVIEQAWREYDAQNNNAK